MGGWSGGGVLLYICASTGQWRPFFVGRFCYLPRLGEKEEDRSGEVLVH